MKIIKGKNIQLRLAETSDADFILSLRSDDNLNKHLSVVENDLQKQIEWLEKYKQREAQKEEYYFIIESFEREKYGTVRLYDFKGDSFCWGSWIIKSNRPSGTTLESFILSIGFGLEELNFSKARWDVRKENFKAIELYKFYGAKIVNEDELNYYFDYKKENYETLKVKYKKFFA